MLPIHIRAEERPEGEGMKRLLLIEAGDDLSFLIGRRLVFHIHSGISKDLPVLDCYLPLMAMLAMAEGRPLRVHGRVTREALINLAEFQEAWSSWRPKLFKDPVEVEADEIVEDRPPGPARALQAYSGGLDAMFTTWTHRVSNNHVKRRPLDRAVFAHGFDIAQKDQNAFSLATRKAHRVLDPVGVELSTIRTNLRASIRLNWEYIHGAALAAVLGQFMPDYTMALIGSSGSYNSLKIPWGSGPITDHLMSGGAMRFIHDGAGSSRLEKIRVIAGWQLAAENLRVCWRSANQWENCGVCEKCVRTALGFRAWGLAIPPSLNAALKTADVKAFLDSPRASIHRIRELHALAVHNRIRDPWVGQLRRKLLEERGIVKPPVPPRAPRDLASMPVAGAA